MLNSFKPLSQKDLENAREEFRSLLAADSPEPGFQKLFSRCPFILSRAIPLRLEPHEIRALARPGISEADFVFYPSPPSPLFTFGVIELKRPSTRLVTNPRRDLVILSRDAQTAIAQGRKFAEALGRQLLAEPTKVLFLGNRGHVFVIAGLTADLLNHVRSQQTEQVLDGLVPSGCQIIPYDTLFSMFAASVPPRVLVLTPPASHNASGIDALAKRLDQPSWRMAINDENFAFWSLIETEWRNGGYVGTKRPREHFGSTRPDRILVRSEWCVSGTDVLATESPAHVDFPNRVHFLVDMIRYSAQLHAKIAMASERGFDPNNMGSMLTDTQLDLLRQAVDDCRTHKLSTTWFEPTSPDTQFFEELGLIHFDWYDSGEFYFALNPVLFEILK